jgi:hypothetical protein
MVYFHPPITHHLLQLAVANGIEALPAHTPEDYFRQKVTPLERGFGVHGAGVGE